MNAPHRTLRSALPRPKKGTERSFVLLYPYTWIQKFTRIFGAETPVKILFQHLEGHAVPLQQLVPNLPASLTDLVASTMARDVEARPRNVEELASLVDAELVQLGEARERT